MTMPCHWDVVVVGAGPAGALSAYELARRGVRVLLVDKTSFPRRKVCGACLNGWARATLRRASLGELTAAQRAIPLTRVFVGTGARTACLPLTCWQALSRESLDAALVKEAVAVGAVFLPNTRAQLGDIGKGRREVLLGGEERVLAGVVLVASGLGMAAGEWTAAAEPGSRIGAGAVVETPLPFYEPGTIYMACGPGGYVGSVRVEDGRLNVAAAFDLAFIRQQGGPGPAACALLGANGWPLPDGLGEAYWRGTPALTRRARRVTGERLFVVGDAAGYVEPFTGEGMAWALASAAAVAPLAARPWHKGLARHWEWTQRRLLARRQLICRAVAHLLRSPFLTQALVGVLARAPGLATPFLRHLDGGPL